MSRTRYGEGHSSQVSARNEYELLTFRAVRLPGCGLPVYWSGLDQNKPCKEGGGLATGLRWRWRNSQTAVCIQVSMANVPSPITEGARYAGKQSGLGVLAGGGEAKLGHQGRGDN